MTLRSLKQMTFAVICAAAVSAAEATGQPLPPAPPAAPPAPVAVMPPPAPLPPAPPAPLPPAFDAPAALELPFDLAEPFVIEPPPAPPAPPAPFAFEAEVPDDLPFVFVDPIVAPAPAPPAPPELAFLYTPQARRKPDPRPAPKPQPVQPKQAVALTSQAEALYSQARQLIDQGRFDRAIQLLDRVANIANSSRADAALYWKSYSQGKLAQVAEALATLSDMQKRFPDSRWGRDARALEVQFRQASGQNVSPEAQADEELKLLALRGLMRTDAERAVGMIEQLLAGNSSVRVKENALFVLSQSQAARAREIIRNVAKGAANPDLQLRAVRYLGTGGGAGNRQLLDEVYRSSTDVTVKRAILRSFMTSGDRERLAALARNESAAELREEAVRQLGAMRATTELGQLYDAEASADVKRRLLQAMFTSGMADKLLQVARTDRDAELRRAAVRNLGLMRAERTGDTLKTIYTAESDATVKKEVINALFVQQNAEALVDIARAEKDPAMKREVVSKLSVLKSKVAVDYMVELLK